MDDILDPTPNATPAPTLTVELCTVTAVSVTGGICTVTWPSGASTSAVVSCYPFPAVADKVYVATIGNLPIAIAVQYSAASSGLTGMAGFTRSSAAPSGWLFANGGAINAAHTALIALVGANTPDWRGVSPIGAGGTYTNGTGYGTLNFALTTTELPAHTHGMSHTHPIGSGSNVSVSGSNRQEPGSSSSATSGSASSSTTDSTGSGGTFSLLHPVTALNPIIHV